MLGIGLANVGCTTHFILTVGLIYSPDLRNICSITCSFHLQDECLFGVVTFKIRIKVSVKEG